MTKHLELGLVLALTVLPGACGDDSGGKNNTNDNTNASDVARYVGAGARGDLVTFTINHEDSSYVVYNETTNQEEIGTYRILGSELSGVYEISVGQDKFYAVELNDKIIAANFPTGNPDNTISFGLSAETSPSVRDIEGNYVYFVISNGEVNGSRYTKEWGLVSLGDSGEFLVKSYATSTGNATDLPEMAPENLSAPFPITQPDLEGTWSLDTIEPGKLTATIGEEPQESISGYAYADPTQAAFVLDLGPGNGFLLAFHVFDVSSVASIDGDYKFINVWNDQNMTGRSAGAIHLDSNGTSSFSHLDVDGNISMGTVENLTQCSGIPNMFYFDSEETGHGATVHERFYFVIMNEMVMGFGFITDNDQFLFTSYSAGAKL